jgi:hypothetical protein
MVNTFLPISSYEKSLACLDYRRLGKQRVEAFQILNILTYESTGKWLKEPAKSSKRTGWINHPATRMWRGYAGALQEYMNCSILEWIKRGYNNTMLIYDVHKNLDKPAWFGDEKFHASHRSNLLRKNKEFYGLYGWSEPDDLPYVWPVPPQDKRTYSFSKISKHDNLPYMWLQIQKE